MSQDTLGVGQRLNLSFWTGFIMGLAAPALILTAMTKRAPPLVHEALASDWRKVGEDMTTAIKKVRGNKVETQKAA